MVAKMTSVPPLSVKYVEDQFENPAEVPFAIDPPNCNDLFIPQCC